MPYSTEGVTMTTQVTVIGNLTRDPELRFTAKGDAVATLSVAVNERVKERDGWVDGEPSFYDVTAWKQLGENAAERLRKGDRIVIIGKMKIEKYETKEGEQRQKPVITADEIAESIRFKGIGAPANADAPRDDVAPF